MNGKDGWWFVLKAPEKNLLKPAKLYGNTSTGDGRGLREGDEFKGWDMCQLGTRDCLLLIGRGSERGNDGMEMLR